MKIGMLGILVFLLVIMVAGSMVDMLSQDMRKQKMV